MSCLLVSLRASLIRFREFYIALPALSSGHPNVIISPHSCQSYTTSQSSNGSATSSEFYASIFCLVPRPLTFLNYLNCTFHPGHSGPLLTHVCSAFLTVARSLKGKELSPMQVLSSGMVFPILFVIQKPYLSSNLNSKLTSSLLSDPLFQN